MHPSLRPSIHHPKVKLIFIPKRGFLAEEPESIFFGVEVARPEDVVFFLFEEAELGAGEGLGAFFVVAAVDGV